MKLDILKKLIALANNNPHEHEANAAARRVCRMLAEAMDKGELKWNTKKYTQPKTEPSYRRESYTDSQRYGSYYESEPWYGFYRTREPNFESSIFWDDIFEDFKKTNAEQVKRDSPKYEPGPFGAKREKQREKRNLKCKTCKKERETIFVGAPEVFECNECSWSKWQKERDSKVGESK